MGEGCRGGWEVGKGGRQGGVGIGERLNFEGGGGGNGWNGGGRGCGEGSGVEEGEVMGFSPPKKSQK